MAHIDNEFNKRFSNQQLPNDGFDTEELWDAISKDLDNEQAAPPDDSIFTGKWVMGLVVSLFVLGILGVIYWKSVNDVITQTENNTDDSIVITHSNDKIISSTNTKENNELNVETNTELLNTTKEISPKNELKKQTHTRDVEASNTVKNPFPTINNTQKTTPAKHTSFTENILTPSANFTNKTGNSNTPLMPTNSTSKPLIGNVITTNSTQSPIKNPIDNTTKPLIDNPIKDSPITSNENSTKVSVAVLPSIVALVEINPSNSSALSALSTIETPDSEEFKMRKNLPIQAQVGFTGGINALRLNHQSDDYSDLAELKNTTAKQDLGTSYGVHMGLIFKDRWLLNSGVEYHQLRSKFDYEEVKQIQVLKEEQLLRVWIDVATGDTLNTLYGDTLVNATSTRTVLHHNQFQRISIPLEIGIQESSGKFIYGITAGTVFNFTNKQSGRTLDKLGEIVDFNENDSTAAFKSFDIGLRVSPLVGYQLSENWSLNLRPQWTWHQNANFDGTDIKTGFHQVNLNLSLKYSFK